jgi:ribosome maturation factor RimP
VPASTARLLNRPWERSNVIRAPAKENSVVLLTYEDRFRMTGRGQYRRGAPRVDKAGLFGVSSFEKESARTLFFVSGCAAKHSGTAGVYAEHFQEGIRQTVEPVLQGMGFSLVNLSVHRQKGSTRVNVVIYRKEGVGIDECAAVSGMVLPRLQTLEGLGEVSLEVSSPGTERVLKSSEEFGIFVGRGVRILAGDETEWRGGVIEKADGQTVWLQRAGQTRAYPISAIRKARLDYSVEVEEKNAV